MQTGYVKQYKPIMIVLADTLYQNGMPVSHAYKNFLLHKCNLAALKGRQRMQYGVTVRRCNLRILPTNDALFSKAEDNEFDVLQETAIDPSEPVVLLHKSTENDFILCRPIIAMVG